MNKPLLTVFTPTYNRKHTIQRTFESLLRQTDSNFEWLIVDDGSCDGTRELVLSWGGKSVSSALLVDWMGRITENAFGETFCVDVCREGGIIPLHITYIYKENGGLYTGYNTAYTNIDTELCVCIDSDDYMPDDAVEKIHTTWVEKGGDKYCGITGLDYNVANGNPIGGFFPGGIDSIWFNDLRLKNIHNGDTKQVMRTELMREVAPMAGFIGERNFNPIYMLIQVLDKYPVLLLNENLCWVEYQIGADSMSQGIYKQYVNSPCSFAKMRKLEMSLQHNTLKDRFRSAVHYISSCLIARNGKWLSGSPRKLLTIIAVPFGVLLYLIIRYKTRK